MAAASAACGVPQRTLHRWLDEPAFKAELRRVRRESFTQAVALAQRYSPMAMTVLAQIANDKAAPQGDQGHVPRCPRMASAAFHVRGGAPACR